MTDPDLLLWHSKQCDDYRQIPRLASLARDDKDALLVQDRDFWDLFDIELSTLEEGFCKSDGVFTCLSESTSGFCARPPGPALNCGGRMILHINICGDLQCLFQWTKATIKREVRLQRAISESTHE